MSDTNTQAETTTERKPPTIADIVREKTGDGRLIIDFFTDVMTGRIKGAELCHRIDAAKQLIKYGSKDAAEFIAKYKAVPCGHSTRGRPNTADPCTAEERTLVAVTLNAPPTLTRDFLTVLSGIDEFLMARLIRAQTADGVTIIEFLDDVMQDRTDGFKTHHRIAAAKELIVHIVRDEQGSHTPSPSTTPSPLTGESWGEGDSPVVPAKSLPRTRYGAGTQGGGGGRSTPANPAHPEPNSPVIPAKSLPRTRYGAGIQRGGGRSTAANPARTEPVLSTAEGSAHPEPNSSVIPAKSLPRTRYGAGIQRGGGRSTAANPAHPEPPSSVSAEPRQIVVPAKAGTQGGGGGRNTAANSAHPEPNSSVVPAPTAVVPAKAGTHPRDPDPGSQLETNNSKLETLPARRTRTQRRREGAARAAILRQGSERNKEEKPAPAELTPTERRIREKLKQHWHEPDPYGAPIDSTHPGRSPPS